MRNRPPVPFVVWALGTCGLLACSNVLPGPYGGGSTDGGGARPIHLEITPAGAQQLVNQGGVATSFKWQAFLVFEDIGERTEVTGSCFWTVLPREGQRGMLGTISRGQFQAGVESFGTGEVRAECEDRSATVPLSIVLRAEHLSKADDGSNPPADSAQRFFGSSLANRAPTLLYPPNGVVLPQGLPELRVQYTSQSTDLHEIIVQAPFLDLRVYTQSPRRLTLSPAEIDLISDAAIYGNVSLTVRANKSGEVGFGQTQAILLRTAPAITGANYYFATRHPAGAASGAQGVWRYNWAGPRGALATGYATELSTVTLAGACVGCHALPDNGSVMSYTTNQDALTFGAFLDVTQGGKRSVASGAQWMFSAMAAGGDRFVVAGNNIVTRLTTANGTTDQVLNIGTVAGTLASMPALSPDDNRLVFVRGKAVSGKAESHIQQGSLVLMNKEGNGFGAPADLVTQTGNENNYYPAFAPDNKWVIFSRVLAPASAVLGDSYDNPAAELWAVPADRSRAPIKLTNANTVFSTINSSVVSKATNSFPRFYPLPVTIPVTENDKIRQKPLYYFVFSSRREFGVEITRIGAGPPTAGITTKVLGKVTPGGDSTIAGWNHQLWLSTFDPELADQGLDPSTPAIWLPFQNQRTSNHTPVFTLGYSGPDLP